jgi:hypothetical protein
MEPVITSQNELAIRRQWVTGLTGTRGQPDTRTGDPRTRIACDMCTVSGVVGVIAVASAGLLLRAATGLFQGG